jgi:transposase InsO family protein
VVPQQLVPAVLKEFHDSTRAGHPGVERTIEKVSRHYFWSTLRHDVRKHVRQCADCQRYKFSNMKPTGLLQTPTLARRFETLAIDLYGPLPVTSDGKRWVFAIEDTATRWMELFPLAKATAEACAKCLVDEVIPRYGTPRKVISDNGSQFVSEIMQQTAYCLGIEQILTPVYYPATNPEERRNRELTVQLAIAVEKTHDRWSLALPSVRFAMNSTVHAALGKTPAFLCFGRELRTPLEAHHDLRAVLDNENFVPEITPHLRTMTDILKDVRETYERQQDKVKKYADLRRRPSPPFEVGDRVLVDVHALSRASHSYTSKFAPRRDGPHVVIEKKGPVAYVVAAVDDPERPLGKYHVSALRPFVSSVGESHSEPVAPLRRRGRPRKRSPMTAPKTKQRRTNHALLHAISEEFVEAVEVLLDHEKSKHKPSVPSWIPPEGS